MPAAIKSRINPYVAGNPVHGGEGFFGRKDILREVENVLGSPGQNVVVLVGQRRIGKTSILLQLETHLTAKGYVLIYTDLQDRARLPMATLAGELATEIADTLGLETPTLGEDWDKGFAAGFLPKVRNALAKSDKRLVFLFDEFDVLSGVQRERLPGDAAAQLFFPTLRRWLREDPRLGFVFALGRDLGDLDSDSLSTFKRGQTIRVSVLSREDTVELITAPVDLHYTEEAIDRIYCLTNGHPYFTQLLCSICFELTLGHLTEDEITATLVAKAGATLYSRGENVFEWIWDGLPPAERIVALVLAELLNKERLSATQEEIEKALREKGVKTIGFDLKISPDKMARWQFLVRQHGGYRFLVPVIHNWIRKNKPTALVREELLRIHPYAHQYYQLAVREYESGNYKQTKNNLRRAIKLNPNHLDALLLLGDIELDDNHPEMAAKAYRAAHKLNETEAKDKLIKALGRDIERLERKLTSLEEDKKQE